MNFSSAQSTFRQGSNISLIHSIRTNDAITTTAICNITVFDPDKTILVNYQGMLQNNASRTYNYTLNDTFTNKFGEFCYDITCTDAGLNRTRTFCIELNPAGREFTVAQSIFLIFILIISLVLFGLAMLGSFKIPFRNDRDGEGYITNINFKKPLKLFCITGSYLLLMFIVWVTYNISLGFIQFLPIANFFDVIFRIMLSFLAPIFIVSILFIFIVWVRDLNLQKKIEKGFIVQ